MTPAGAAGLRTDDVTGVLTEPSRLPHLHITRRGQGAAMSDGTVPRTPPSSGALWVAALASAGAGLIHAAAAGAHTGDRVMVVLFAVAAVAQVGWAAVARERPTRGVALAGAGLNAALVLAWLATRTAGLPLVDALREPEAAGVQDTVCAVLGLVAAGLALVAVVRPRRGAGALPPVVASALAVLVVALAVPAMAADHAHGGGEHAHEAGSEHEHEDDAQGEADAPADPGHDHEIPGRLDHEPTDEQLADARRLVADTEAALAGYADVASAEAAGYVSIGDARSGVEHFINHDHLRDEGVLDPNEVESLVYRVAPDGGRELISAMYILPPGSTADDVPDVAGNLTVWHGHDNLCWDPAGMRIAGVVVNGQCRPGGVQGQGMPMLHVWVVPNDCGPFAGTDRRQESGSCVPPDALDG
jgi:hypothetical protein